MEILFGIIIVVLLIAVLNYTDRADAKRDKIEIRPAVWDKPKHPEASVDFTAGGPEKAKPKSPHIPYDPITRSPIMVPHDEAKDATGVSSGYGHDDYRKPKE